MAPGANEENRTKLARLVSKERGAAVRLTGALASEKNRPQLVGERAMVVYRLDQDAWGANGSPRSRRRRR